MDPPADLKAAIQEFGQLPLEKPHNFLEPAITGIAAKSDRFA